MSLRAKHPTKGRISCAEAISSFWFINKDCFSPASQGFNPAKRGFVVSLKPYLVGLKDFALLAMTALYLKFISLQ